MNVLEAISNRRSIRKFQNHPIPDEMIKTILENATKAPSSKNRQPWEFIVTQNVNKKELVISLNKSLNFFKRFGFKTGSIKKSIECIDSAPSVIFIFRSNNESSFLNRIINDFSNIQSIGSAIQNMLLTAEEKGIGSLWICDVLFFENKIKQYFQCKGKLIAAIAFGYPDESPNQRPRKNWIEKTKWYK